MSDNFEENKNTESKTKDSSGEEATNQSTSKHKSEEDNKLHLKSAIELEVHFRRRAINYRRFSWIFLLIIITIIGSSGYIVWGLLNQVSSTEAKVLNDLSNNLKEQVKQIDKQQNELKPKIDSTISEMKKYLTGYGIDWEKVSVKAFSNKKIIDLLKTKEGKLLALTNKNESYTIWMNCS